MLAPQPVLGQDMGATPSPDSIQQQAQKAGIDINSLSPAEKEKLLKQYQASGSQAGGEGSEALGASPKSASGPGPSKTAEEPASKPVAPSPGESRVEKFFSGSLQQTLTAPRTPVEIGQKSLTQFGYRFFARGNAFTPNQSALVGPDYILGPGDGLDIDVWGNIEGNYQVTLDRNGEITLPKVGVINLWGQTFAQAKGTIRKQISKYFSHFELNVTMGSLRSIHVFLVGEVQAPGTYQVSSVSTVLTALSAAGGPDKAGTLRNVELLRNGKLVTTIDFYDFFLRGDKSHDVRLQSGDTIFVPEAGPLVGVAGNVRRPAIYELKGDETVKDALALAGGIIPTAYLQKVQMQRVQAHQEQTVLDLNLTPSEKGVSGGLAMKVQDRDLIKVLPIGRTGKYVTLKGYVARPGDYQLTKGMRVTDLLPADNLLPEYFPGVAQIVRKRPPEYNPEIMTINLEKALQGDLSQNILLKEYDEVKIFSRRQMEELPQVQVTGAVLSPGAFRLYDKMTVKDLIAAAGNLKRSAYLPEAEIMRFTPKGDKTVTKRLVFNLKKALAGDPKANIVLQPEDHLFVRSIPDYAERETVTLKGEVLFPGTYAIAKGESLSSVLKRAGGFTSHAYLRGATFSREAVKATQQKRIDKLIQEQEQQMLQLSTQMAQGALSSADVQASQALLETRKQMLQKLRQLPVTGRMVIHLVSLHKFTGSPSDIQLVGGDTLTVPDNPRSVNVLGQVYNPTALTFRPGFSVAQYLDEVGGPTRDADTSEMFIVRADGTVYSRNQAGMGMKWDGQNHRWIIGGFNTAVLYPGDSILVPEKVETSAVLKNTKDISQIIYQMALGAAAVASF